MTEQETTSKKHRLLGAFPMHDYESWQEAAIQLLKGRPFEKSLITPTYEGFDLNPIYMDRDIEGLSHLDEQPGMGRQVRGARVEGFLENGWLISQELAAAKPEELNRIILKELGNGQNELNLWLDMAGRQGLDPEEGSGDSVGKCGVSLASVKDLEALLEGVQLEAISTWWRTGSQAAAFTGLFVAALEKRGENLEAIRGCLDADPLGWIAETGEWQGNRDSMFNEMASLVKYVRKKLPGFQAVAVKGHAYHDGGGASYQEMGYILATTVEYLNALQERGVNAKEAIPHFRFCLSIGPNYFIEIAKFRAIRILLNRVLDAYEVPEDGRHLHIHARTGLWNKTLFDPYVNMLRTTTEAFSAVIGGCDSMHIGPFDEIVREPDDFSRRIARNTHHVLGEECDLTQVLDPAGGSWAVESLTDKMAQQAWKEFQEIEKAGGMLAALESGRPQTEVEAVRQEKARNIQRRKDVIVGTNNYPNASETILDQRNIDYESIHRERREELKAYCQNRQGNIDRALQQLRKESESNEAGRIEAAVSAAHDGATLGEIRSAMGAEGTAGIRVNPLPLRRAGEEYEKLRFACLQMEEAGKAPVVHQLNIGPSRNYRGRADWTSAFFQVAGMRILNEDDYQNPDEAMAACEKTNAPVAIITSDDETYAVEVPGLARRIKEYNPEIIVLVAGNPGEHESAWNEAGVDDYVHLRVNNYTFNRDLLERLGAEL